MRLRVNTNYLTCFLSKMSKVMCIIQDAQTIKTALECCSTNYCHGYKYSAIQAINLGGFLFVLSIMHKLKYFSVFLHSCLKLIFNDQLVSKMRLIHHILSKSNSS
jgi:hypothetical protein